MCASSASGAQGSLRVNRFNSAEGYVGSESVGQDVLIAGRVAMNRALDGDIVAVELLPEEQWVRTARPCPVRVYIGNPCEANVGQPGFTEVVALWISCCHLQLLNTGMQEGKQS